MPRCRLIAAAVLGADVLGVDIASNLVEAGKKRANEAGLTNCKFQLGDACELRKLEDNSFDLIVSMFGAMFAPKPLDVAKEMVRVSRSGGRIVMGNWMRSSQPRRTVGPPICKQSWKNRSPNKTRVPARTQRLFPRPVCA